MKRSEVKTRQGQSPGLCSLQGAEERRGWGPRSCPSEGGCSWGAQLEAPRITGKGWEKEAGGETLKEFSTGSCKHFPNKSSFSPRAPGPLRGAKGNIPACEAVRKRAHFSAHLLKRCVQRGGSRAFPVSYQQRVPSPPVALLGEGSRPPRGLIPTWGSPGDCTSKAGVCCRFPAKRTGMETFT